MGHFQEVHDISDPHYRQLIVNTLGINLWGDWEMKPEHGQEHKPRGRMEEDRRSGRMDLDKVTSYILLGIHTIKAIKAGVLVRKKLQGVQNNWQNFEKKLYGLNIELH